MAVSSPFQWGMGGQAITSPEQAARKRAIAEALIAQSATPGNNWAEGLADIAAALSGTVLEGRVSEAEAAGRERAGGLFADLAVNTDPNSIIAALTSPDAAWVSPAQTSIASALLQSGLERQDPMYQAQLAKLQAEAAAGPKQPTSFGTPIWGTDPSGSPVFGTLDNAGNFNVTNTPEGFSFGKEPIRLDTGTEYTLLDPVTRQVVGTQPKNLRDAAAQSAAGAVEGKSAAEGAIAAQGDIQTGEMALDLINQIKNHPALESGTGFFAGVGGNAIPGTPNFDFQNLVEQAKSGAFLSAIQQMRGMGSLSNAEGQAATQAVTRMNTATSKEAFLKAVEDYESIVLKGVASAQRRGGSSPSPIQVEVIDWTDL